MNSNPTISTLDGDAPLTVAQHVALLLHGHEHDPGITYRIECDEETYVLLSRVAEGGDCDLPTEYDQQCVATVWDENGEEPDVRMIGTFRDLARVISMMRGDRFGGPFE